MPDKLYSALGVKKDASQDDIKKAYRKLVKKYHPDLNPGDKSAEERFKAVSAAYDIIGTPETRGQYDRGEIDQDGTEQARQHYSGQQYYRQYADSNSAHPYHSDAGYQDMGDLNHMFSNMFQERQQNTQRGFSGTDLRYHMTISFLEAALGCQKQVQMADGANLKVSIPKGIETGKTIRLKGKGSPGMNGGPAGDALIQIEVTPHETFRRNGLDIEIDLPVTPYEAALGDRITIPTLHGRVTMNLPKGSLSGKIMRLKARGIEAENGNKGDQLVRVVVQMPEKIDPDVRELLEKWKAANPYDPRANLKGTADV